MNEKHIIRSIQNGDTDLFYKLYELYREKVYRFVYYKTLHKETTEDITSMVFLKAFEKINSVDSNKSFATWLFTIARNSVIDHYRTFKSTSDISDAWDIGEDDGIQEKIDIELDFQALQQHMQKLTPLQREIITLRIWENLSYKEIAELLSKSEGSVKMQFSRTIKELQKHALLLFIFLNLPL